MIADTGSTDGTVEVARSLGARVHSFPWVDHFAAARNSALDACTGDWVLSLDADEQLADGSGDRMLRLISRTPDIPLTAYSVLVRDATDADGVAEWGTFHALRLFPRNAKLRWAKRVHEQIRHTESESKLHLLTTDDVVIIHRGYLKPTWEGRGKDDRNLRLLELSLADDPTDPTTWQELARQHYSAGRPDDALAAAERCIELAREQKRLAMNFTGYAWSFAVGACAQTGRYAQGITLGIEGVKYHGASANLWANLGVCYHGSGRAADALACYDRAMNAAVRPNPAYEVDGALTRWRLWWNAGNSYAAMGEMVRAVECHRQAMHGEPGVMAPWRDAARCLGALGETDLAMQTATALLQRWPDSEEGAALLAKLEGRQVA